MVVSPEHAFNDHFRRLGGRVPDIEGMEDLHPGIPVLKTIVHDFRNWLRWSLEPTKLGRDHIHGDVIRSNAFNAYAATSPALSLDLIGVTLPVLFSLRTLTGLAAQYFQRGHPPAVLAEHLRATTWTDISSVKEFLRTAPDYSYTDQQKTMCNTLYESCLSCLIMHEIGHIGFGHADFIRVEFGATEMAEISSAFRMHPDLKHIMELEADRGIALHIANTTQQELDVALTACLLLFDVLTERSKPMNLYSSGSHPHPIVRFSSIIMNLGDMTGQGKAGGAALRRLSSRQGRWARGGLCETVTKGFDAMSKDAIAEMDRLWDEFNRTYRGSLERFRRQ